MRLSVSEARTDGLVTNMAPAAMMSASGQVDFIFILLLLSVVGWLFLTLESHCQMRRLLAMGCNPTVHLGNCPAKTDQAELKRIQREAAVPASPASAALKHFRLAAGTGKVCGTTGVVCVTALLWRFAGHALPEGVANHQGERDGCHRHNASQKFHFNEPCFIVHG